MPSPFFRAHWEKFFSDLPLLGLVNDRIRCIFESLELIITPYQTKADAETLSSRSHADSDNEVMAFGGE